MITHQKRFKDTVIFLDGSTFVGCKFDGCTLIYSGYMPVMISGCTLADCHWQFAGPAANTIRFMSTLYAQGGASHDLIEHIFNSIREGDGAPSGGPVTLN